MDTLFSNVVATIRGVINSGKKIIVASILVSLLLSNVPVMVPTAQAQASGYSGPTGYETANDIEKAVTGAAATAEGPLKNTVNDVLEHVGRFLANIFLLFSRLLLKMASFMIDFIMVIAGYNAYIDSTAVNVGWTVVRDITNMLFIVILLVISFATILGLEGYEWKQLLPKLVSAAILVNFSRTICGLLIDASQVIMMTFLNAVSATIGGNIINAFRLPTFEAFHANIQSQQLTSSGILSAAALALFFSGLVAATLGAYVFILLGRLIRLWVLIVLSPLAFVLGILPATSGMSSKWWSELADNLITGPVIMFFIWLSLIVVGTGQANQELVKGSRMADKSPIEQAFGPQEQMLTPTDIGGWNNLANFVIAIGMLFAGAKVASSIGGSSGNLLEAGLDFGKKVALAGLGYGLIRSVGDRTASASRSMAGKASDAVFGTLAKPFVRAKKITGSFLSAVSYGAEEARNLKAKDIEEKRRDLAEKGKLNPITSMLMRGTSWALSSENRLDNNVKKWEALAAEKKKQAEESYGTSNWKAGTSLEREKIRTERLVAESDKSKALKDAQRRMEFSGGVSWVGEQLGESEKHVAKMKDTVASLKGSTDTAAYNKAVEELANAEGELATRRETTEKELRKRYGNNKKVDPDYILEYYDKGRSMLRKSAEAEHLNHIMHNNDAMAVARQKDNLMIEEGKPHLAVFEHQEHARQEKERRDLLSTGNFDLAMAKIEQVRDKITGTQSAIDDLKSKIASTKNPAEINAFQNQLIQLEHKGNEHMIDMARLMSANAARGTGFSVVGLDRALEKIKDLPPVLAGDVEGQQARVLSAILQTKVESGKVKEAFEQLSSKMGESFDAFMESFSDSLNSAAAGGAVNYAGLFRGEFDSKDNKLKYHVVDMGNPADVKYSSEQRAQALAQSNINRINSFVSSLDHLENKAVAVTQEAVSRMAEKFGGITVNQAGRVDDGVLRELTTLFSNMEKEQNTVLLQALASKNTDTNGLATLLKKVNAHEKIMASLPSGAVDVEDGLRKLKESLHETGLEYKTILETAAVAEERIRKDLKAKSGAFSTSGSTRSSRPAV